MRLGAQPVWVMVALAAWAATAVYFVVAAFATQRIKSKEAAPRRALDMALLFGGYVLLFLRLPNAAWERMYVPLSWAAAVGRGGAALAVTGLALALWARIALGQYWSQIVVLKEDHRLVRTGPYAVVRHPLYSGLLLATLGTALAFGRWHAAAGVVLLWIGFLARARREDALLAKQFGAEFDAYRAQSGRLTPRWYGGGGAGSLLLGAGLFVVGAGCLFSGSLVFAEQPVPAWVPWPAALVLALVTGVILMAASAGLLARGAAHVAALTLAVMLGLWCVLFNLPAVVHAPLVLATWGGLSEIVMPAVAAWMLWRGRGTAARVPWARVLFGAVILVNGCEHFVYWRITETMVPGFLGLGPAGKLWVVHITGGFHIAAGLAIMSGVLAKVAARLWALMLTLFAALVWIPIVAARPGRQFDWSELLLTTAIAGAGWVLAQSYRGDAAAGEGAHA